MSDLAVLILLAAACSALGYVLLRALLRPDERFGGDRLAFLFACLILGVTVAGWFGLVLAELGWFSAGRLGIVWALLVLLGLLILWRRRGRRTSPAEPDRPAPADDEAARPPGWLPDWMQGIALALWLVAAMWLFLRPHEFILGAADAGVYVNLAANIANTGGIVELDDTLAQIDPALQESLLRPLPDNDLASEIAPSYLFPAFFVTDATRGEITPQFYHLHPVWQAIAYDLGGIQADLLMSGFWALLACLALYLVMRRLFGWEMAFIGLVGLSINALQVWFARYPTTEMLTQFLLWSAIWSMMRWVQDARPRRLWAILGGLALGELFLVRIDAYFLLILPLAIWLWLRWTGRWRRQDWLFFIPLALLTIHSFVHALWQSRPYFYSIFGYGLFLLRTNPALPVGVVLIGGVLLLLLGRYRHQLERFARYRRPIAWAAVALVLALALYAYFVRPHLGSVTTYDYWYGGGQVPTGLDRENLVRLGWYLSPLGIALATVGIGLMILQLNRQIALVLVPGLLFSLLYLWRIQANPHQVYTMRRYVPAVLPFAILATAYLMAWISNQAIRWRRPAALLLAALWLASLALSARGFIRQIDYQGITAELSAFDAQLAPGSVILFNRQAPISSGDTLGTPLHYLFGHDVYTLRDLEALDMAALTRTLNGWLAGGRAVYWVGPLDPLASLDWPTEGSFETTIRAFALEASYDYKPADLLEAVWRLEVTRLGES
ncbi:MAG: hypothetical protein PVG33_15495 [Chloroflexota bacterium]|jgi:4-amino-4-deoxy-L-arabinose transferase-like glycosyltransferase